jgi:hypothetical protein
MDDLVKQAMAKWPNVPNCYGWLGLSARGDWYLRDDAAQAAGPFAGEGASPASKGSRLEHAKLIEFIGRNYLSDEDGRWFFQNGPQRVYVELEATPLIARLLPDNTVQDHRGEQLNIQRCLLDEEGHLYLDCNEGIARLHTQDIAGALPLVEVGLWVPQMLVQASLEQRFEYCKSPLNKKPTTPA